MPPPTPQQSFSQSQPTQPHGMPGYGHSYNMSFESPSHSQPVYSQSFPNGPVSNPGYARSFGESYGQGRGYGEKPQIYTAVYSGVSVYEMEVAGVACMRRRSDGWLNATQILKIAGVDKGKRTKILEKEILPGEHEKVQGGYGKYQGTWISYRRGREFCRQYGVEDILRPLLEYDISSDGSGGQGQETPTKEQAMAANRKRIYQPAVDGGRPQGPVSNGTFFQNISPTSSVALAAMNKAARIHSPAPRPASAQRLGNMRHPSQSDMYPGGSQQSQGSFIDDSGYGTQQNGSEPPRKRMRQDSQDGMAPPALPLDASMRSASPTEPSESFMYDSNQQAQEFGSSGEPVTLPPLPAPQTDEEEEKYHLILDLLSDAGGLDYASHDAIKKLSGEELNMPLDHSANNAVHWAATMGKLSLLKLLISRGANIWRGNAAGQSPLVSAVLVANCWDKTCFPELLELLGPLIEVRDAQGRTILHHIAVSSAIKGRAPASKYYLEALLEYLVRIGTQTNNSAATASSLAAAAVASMKAQANGDPSSQDSISSTSNKQGAVSLVRFLSHIVNARDKAGNTALNLVARIGNRSIIQQLLEIHADSSIANYKGVSAKSFGIGIESGDQPSIGNGSASQQLPQSLPPTQEMVGTDVEVGEAEVNGSQIEEMSQDVMESMTTMLTQNLNSHKETLRLRTEQVDRLNEQIRELSALQKADLERLQALKDRVKLRSERQAKITNLKRAVHERRNAVKPNRKRGASAQQPEQELIDNRGHEILSHASPNGDSHLTRDQHTYLTNNPHLASTAPKQLQSRISAYQTHNAALQDQATDLASRSSELEATYRKVVSLCTGVPEERVEENLGALVAAVESERGVLGEGEVGRVREFLKRVDGQGFGGIGES
ncbi:transcriptional regulator swi6 [Recurvomyces mirabilis]|nr:transcriptional regulator swi6 [Recurvomyces mirabilis]